MKIDEVGTSLVLIVGSSDVFSDVLSQQIDMTSSINFGSLYTLGLHILYQVV